MKGSADRWKIKIDSVKRVECLKVQPGEDGSGRGKRARGEVFIVNSSFDSGWLAKSHECLGDTSSAGCDPNGSNYCQEWRN